MSAQRTILTTSIFLASISGFTVAAPSLAHADRYELSLGSSTRHVQSTSADALSDDILAVFSMTGAVAIDRIKVPLFDRFAIEGGFDAGALTGTSFQTLETSTSFLHWTLGARVTRDLGRRLSVHGRAALGLARIGVTIDDIFMNGPTLGDSGYTGTGYVGAAGDIYLIKPGMPEGARLSLGLRLEVGYLAMIPKSLEARPDGSDHEDGAILIPEMSAPLGDLDLSALSLRFGLVGRF